MPAAQAQSASAAQIAPDCEIEAYDDMDTTSAVLRSNLSPQLKALVIILRRLYKQAGGGRKLNAFTRGITRADVLPFVEPVIALLVQHGFVSMFNSVAHPVRNQAGRVEGMLASPPLSNDVVAVEARSLK